MVDNNNNDANTIASSYKNNDDASRSKRGSISTLSKKEDYHERRSRSNTSTSSIKSIQQQQQQQTAIIDLEKSASAISSETLSKTKNDHDEESNKSSSDDAPPILLTKRQRIIKTTRFCVLMFGLLMGMFMVCLNTTVVAPAMNIIATELNDIGNQTWIATAYLVAMNSFQALAGKFSDVFGRKPIVLFGMFFFTMGSLINALAPTMNGLIAGRTIQGFGAGAILSMLFVIITDVAPYRLRPKFQSSLAVIYGLSSVIGPLIGGAFVDKLTWRWDFWLNVILGGFSFSVTLLLFKEPIDIPKSTFIAKIKRIDWLGTLFSMSFVCCLLLGLSWGSAYGWNSSHSYGSFIGAAVSLIGLIVAEGWISPEPLMPKEVVLNPSILIVYVYVMCLGLSFIGTLYFGPVLYQSVFGASSTQSGIRLIPYMILLVVGSVGSSFLIGQYVPYMKYFLLLAGASNLLGYGLFYTVNENSNYGQQSGYLVFCGLAFGLSQQNAILTVQKVAERKYMAVATTLLNFFMMLASSVGIAIFQTLFELFLTQQFKTLTPEEFAMANEYGAIANYLFIRDLPDGLRQTIIKCYSEALHLVFILPLVAAGLGFIATIFIKKVRFLGRHRKEEEIQEQKNDQQEDQGATTTVVVTQENEKRGSNATTASVENLDQQQFTTRTLPTDEEDKKVSKTVNTTTATTTKVVVGEEEEEQITNRIKSYMSYKH